MAVSKRVRYEVLRRDNHACRYCGATAPETKLVVDHVVPVALGGADAPTNLVAACEPCNSGKTSTTPDGPLVADVEDQALAWSRHMRAAAEITRADLHHKQACCEAFEQFWSNYYGTGYRAPLPDDWRQSIDMLRISALDPGGLFDAVCVALDNPGVAPGREFRYFMGVCWSKLRHQQDIAFSFAEKERTERSGGQQIS